MSFFSSPVLQEPEFYSFGGLSLEANFDLSGEDLAALQSALSFADALHVTLREPAEVRGQACELRCLLGFHAESESRGSKQAPFFHYEISLQPRTRPRTESVAEWTKAAETVKPLIPKHPAPIDLRLYVPRSSILAVKLPITLPETPGFDEIRGVRLAKTDPTGAADELYFTVVDMYKDKVSLYTHITADVSFDQDMLQDAMNSALTVTRLAATRSV